MDPFPTENSCVPFVVVVVVVVVVDVTPVA